MSSTIAAIATAQAAAGIGVIRISGDEARKIAASVFHKMRGTGIMESPGYTAAYGKIVDGEQVIDEAVALVFAAPHSYTGEDVVELSCHGGMFLLQKVLRTVYRAGAVPAEPGEFTRRAFLNGKLDLTQAEGIQNIIGANGEQAARAAIALREGAVSKQIAKIKESLLFCAAHMSVWADYPDEDIETLETEKLKAQLQSAYDVLQEKISQFDAGKALREGVQTVIVGRPNVGKSTLMNLISGTERSIVTPIAGTTRDIVEETVRLGDIVLHISDTAGLRKTDNLVESIGVDRAKEKMKEAGLILAVFDCSQPLEEQDFELLQMLEGRDAIAIVNKTDLKDWSLDVERLKAFVPNTVLISASTGEGYELLEKTVAEIIGTSKLDPAAGILASERQRNCCVRAADALMEGITALECGMTLDAVNVCTDEALAAFMELTGERVTEAVSNEVFSKFCVGK